MRRKKIFSRRDNTRASTALEYALIAAAIAVAVAAALTLLGADITAAFTVLAARFEQVL